MVEANVEEATLVSRDLERERDCPYVYEFSLSFCFCLGPGCGIFSGLFQCILLETSFVFQTYFVFYSIRHQC